MSANMATATYMDTGQSLSYLFVFVLPLLIHYLVSYLLKLSPVDRRAVAKLFWSPPPPDLWGRLHSPTHSCSGPRCCPAHTIDRQNIVNVRMEASRIKKHERWQTHLFPILWRTYQVGFCVLH